MGSMKIFANGNKFCDFHTNHNRKLKNIFPYNLPALDKALYISSSPTILNSSGLIQTNFRFSLHVTVIQYAYLSSSTFAS